LAFIERCLKTSEVGRQSNQNKNNSIPAKGRTSSDWVTVWTWENVI